MEFLTIFFMRYYFFTMHLLSDLDYICNLDLSYRLIINYDGKSKMIFIHSVKAVRVYLCTIDIMYTVFSDNNYRTEMNSALCRLACSMVHVRARNQPSEHFISHVQALRSGCARH